MSPPSSYSLHQIVSSAFIMLQDILVSILITFTEKGGFYKSHNSVKSTLELNS